MHTFLYTFAIHLYSAAVRIAALFNSKAHLLVKGHRQTFRILGEKLCTNEHYVWFHAASLGEFEQGRPIIERLRKEHPEWRILLTFFSPSGYEVRKNYEGADIVCYLPFDTPANARKFVRMVRPVMAFFIKYEFWQHYLTELRNANVPAYSVSSIFRDNQLFFRSYGRRYANATLCCFTHFFVQNERSRELLASIGLTNVTITGDTRFDRVIDIYRNAKVIPAVEQFLQSKDNKPDTVMVAGSTWPPDEDILIPYFNAHPNELLILAPHVVAKAHLQDIESKLTRPSVRLSEATPETLAKAECLIVDTYGMLSSIYRYGTQAYVGGGFGVGIHNVPEAAVYGIPVVIGPNNKHFREAVALLDLGGAFEISSPNDYIAIRQRMDDDAFRTEAGRKAGAYIADNGGATDAICQYVYAANGQELSYTNI